MDINQLTSIIKNVSPQNKTIELNSLLVDDLGLCSFDMMLIFGQLINQISRNIDLDDFSNAKTVNDIFQVINKE